MFTALGVSNVSFGVRPAARGVLNSVFLYHAVQAGLDMAIVNPAHITPYAEIPDDQRQLANDLIFNSDPDALPRFIQYFEENEVAVSGQDLVDPTADMTAEEALHWQITHRKKEGVEALIDTCLTRQDAVGVLNNVLLPAMKEVGDKFGAGELILPFVLQSAEVMKKSVAYLENFLERAEGAMDGAEDALRDGDLAEAIDRQAEAMEALREGMRNIEDGMRQQAQNNQQGEQGELGGQPQGQRRAEPARVLIDRELEAGVDVVGDRVERVVDDEHLEEVVRTHRRPPPVCGRRDRRAGARARSPSTG